MKINFIIPFKRMSGGIRVIFLYANYLSSIGNDVVCYCPMISYKGKNDSLLFQIKSSLSNTFKIEKWFDINFSLKLVPIIKNVFIRDADIVVASSWQTAYDVEKLNANKGRKYYFVQGYEIFNGKKEDVEKTYKFNFTFLTISKYLERIIKEHTNNKIYILHNGLNNEEYIQNIKKRNKYFTILFLTHEEKYKGTDEAIDVIEKFKKYHKNVKAITFGRKITRKFPKDYSVYESPSRDKLMELYRKADVYLFTSTEEAWGLPIIEAMANKCAVIGRNIGALEEIGNKDNCKKICSKDEMYCSLEFLYNNYDALCSIQEKAYKTAKTLSWDVSFERLNKIFNEGGKFRD